METLLFGIGQAISGVLFRFWLENSTVAKDGRLSLKELMRRASRDSKERRALGREFERISEQVADRLSPFFEVEFGGLPENEKRAAAEEVRKTLEGVSLDDELLFAVDLSPQALEQTLKDSRPDAAEKALLSAAGTAFYDRILREAANYIVEIRITLPDFGSQAARTMLERETELIALVRTVLDRLPDEGPLLESSETMRFEAQYRRDVARKLDRLVLFGLTTAELRYRYSLSVAYLTLTVSAKPTAVGEGWENEEDAQVGGTSNGEKAGEVASLAVDAALKSRKRILVRGEAGSGKTTLLQWLAVNGARGSFATLPEWNDTIPFLVQLRRFVDSSLPSVTEFASGINTPRTEPDGWAQRQMDSGKALVLVDGIDELPEERREEARQWLTDLVEAFPDNRYVVTSRPPAAGEDWLADQGFDALLLEPMELPAIQSFVDHWHNAALDSVSDADEQEELGELAQRLKEIVRSNRAIRSLASSPLLCAMLCALNRDRRAQLPSDRIELYRIALEMMLARRDAERKVRGDVVDIGLREKEILLRVFALWLLNNGMSYASDADLEALVAARLEGMPRVEASAADVVKHLLIRSGVLRQPVEGSVDFIHRTFQEYLAAEEAVETRSIGVLVKNAHLDQWLEVIVLAAGLASLDVREELIGALIERGNEDPNNKHRLHLLAVGCLETSAELSPGLTDSVNLLLASLIPPHSMTEARAIASAGEVAVELLGKGAKGEIATVTAACARALTLIGGDSALSQLERFGPDQRVTVARELIRAWDDYPGEEYAKRVLAKSRLDHFSVEVTNPGQLAGVRWLERLRRLSCNGVADATPGGQWPWHVLDQLSGLSSLWLASIGDMEALPRMTGCDGLNTVEIFNMPDLVAIEDELPSGVSRLSIQQCHELRDASGLQKLDGLRALEIGYCYGLNALPPLPPGLERLYCEELEIGGVGSLADCPEMRLLKLDGCSRVEDLSSLANLSRLEMLTLGGCESLGSIEPLEKLRDLQVISISGADDLCDAEPIASCKSVVDLALEELSSLEDVGWLGSLEKLRQLSLSGCSALAEIPDVTLPHLRRLMLVECSEIDDLEPLVSLPALRSLYLDFCPIRSVEPLTRLSNLQSVSLRGCDQLEDISPLLKLPELDFLDLRGMRGSFELEPFEARGVHVSSGAPGGESSLRAYYGLTRTFSSDFWLFKP